MEFMLKCCGCWTTRINYKSSYLVQDSRRQIVSLAISLAFFISGHGYAGYRKTLGRGLGIGVTSEKPFLEVIDLALPHIKEMLDEMCDDAKHQMKQLSPDQIGSWSRAVTCCDGCCLTRGHFSQNCTFIKITSQVPSYIMSICQWEVQAIFAMQIYGKALPRQWRAIWVRSFGLRHMRKRNKKLARCRLFIC